MTINKIISLEETSPKTIVITRPNIINSKTILDRMEAVLLNIQAQRFKRSGGLGAAGLGGQS